MAWLVPDILDFVCEVELALNDIPRAFDADNNPDGVLLNAELLLRDTVLMEPLLPEEEGRALTGIYIVAIIIDHRYLIDTRTGI